MVGHSPVFQTLLLGNTTQQNRTARTETKIKKETGNRTNETMLLMMKQTMQ